MIRGLTFINEVCVKIVDSVCEKHLASTFCKRIRSYRLLENFKSTDDGSYVPNDKKFIFKIQRLRLADFTIGVATSPSVFITIQSVVLGCWTYATKGCRCRHGSAKPLPKFLVPLVEYHCEKRMFLINHPLLGLSVCLISSCPSLIALRPCLIS